MIEIETVEHIIVVVIAFLILFNIYLNYNKIENDTINEVLKNWAYSKYFFITFIWGVLGGHFFLGSPRPVFGSNWWIPVVLVIALVILLIFIGNKRDHSAILKRRYQLVLLVSGVLYGHFFWSQRHIPDISFPWMQP